MGGAMKNKIIFVLLIFMGIAAGQVIYAGEQQKLYDDLYNQWHAVLNTQPILREPQWTRTGPVNEMKQAGIAFATYLCNRIAGEVGTVGVDPDLYQDLILLDQVAGINLIFGDSQSDFSNIAESMPKAVARFKQEWTHGIYNNPSKRVRELCKQTLPHESDIQIAPWQVISLRRYGIFGLPELIKQIKEYNSKHAFAAFLIISGQNRIYADYLQHSDALFASRTQKLDQIARYIEKIKETSSEQELTRRIVAAMSE